MGKKSLVHKKESNRCTTTLSGSYGTSTVLLLSSSASPSAQASCRTGRNESKEQTQRSIRRCTVLPHMPLATETAQHLRTTVAGPVLLLRFARRKKLPIHPPRSFERHRETMFVVDYRCLFGFFRSVECPWCGTTSTGEGDHSRRRSPSQTPRGWTGTGRQLAETRIVRGRAFPIARPTALKCRGTSQNLQMEGQLSIPTL